MIGGNITALLQVKSEGQKNAIGEKEHIWEDVYSLKGFLDFMGGQNDHTNFKGKVQDTTHLFICDFKSLQQLSTNWNFDPFNLETGVISTKQDGRIVDVTSENARMIIKDNVYEILMIDDPMGINHHLEIYLKYVGGGLGV